MKNFNYYQPTEIVFGVGRVSECGTIANKYGKRVLIVTTEIFEAIKPAFELVMKSIKSAGLEVAHFDGVIPNPTVESVAEGAALAKEFEADVVVGFGGGSSMDTAKAIAVEATHKGSAWDYLFYKKEPTENTLPIIAISTTSGTGSQMTQVSVITNTVDRDKSAIYHPNIYPKVAIVDPEMMLTLPPQITAPTGFDAFTHAFESLLHPNVSPYIEMMSWEAVRLVIENLPVAVVNGGDIEARTNLAWADTLAGLCIANAGVTLPHGMSMAIGGMYPRIAHGQGLAIVYPEFAAFTQSSAVEVFAKLSRMLNSDLGDLSDAEAAEQASSELRVFLKSVNLDLSLSKFDVPKDELNLLAEKCMVLPDYKGNPRVATQSEMLELVESAF